MKKLLSLYGITALCAVTSTANPKDFPQGGVSIDFSKTFKAEKLKGKNLILNGDFEKNKLGENTRKQWYGRFLIHAYKRDLPNPKALREKLNPLVTQKILSKDGQKYLELASPLAIMKYRPKGKPLMSNRIIQYIELPELNAPTKFRLSLKYRGKINAVQGHNSLRLFALFKDNLHKYNRKAVNRALPVSGKWKNANVSFIAPENTSKLGIILALYGSGQIFIDDVKLIKVKSDDGVIVKLTPCSFLDKVFVMSENDPSIMSFIFKNEKNAKIDQPYLYLKLPAGVEIIDQRNSISAVESKKLTEKGQEYTIYKINLNRLKHTFGKEQFNVYNNVSVMVKTNLPVGTKKYNAAYWYQDRKYQTEPENIHLKIMPQIKSRHPKLFQTGVVVGREADFVGEGVKEFVSFYKRSGFNVVHGSVIPKMNIAYKKAGILRYTQPYMLCNGYRIGPNNKPDSVQFQFADGSYIANPHQAICPTAVYKQSPYYKKVVVNMLKEILVTKDSADSIMPNWEPNQYNFRGCFCLRCKTEFIKYSGLSKADVDAVWPATVIVKYKDKWIKFRSWQHGQLCIQLEKTINKIGKSVGKDSHFAPEIYWGLLTEKGNAHLLQDNPKDYMDKLPIIEPWGPYIVYRFDEPYIYNPGIHLTTFFAGREVKKFVAKHIKDENKRPKLIAFPHGYQSSTWVTEPEAIGFETLCYFLNGWGGSIVYYFPRGYDNRWWNVLADANKKIAMHENFVFKGKKINDCKVFPVSPVPQLDVPSSQKLPFLKTAKIIQTVEYKLGDKRMVAIGNFWQKGEFFVKLSVDNLAVDTKYVLREVDAKRCFGVSLTAAELKKGVMVHIGALRWAFFIIEPYRKGFNYGKTISRDFMKKLLKQRLPKIEEAIEWEKKYQAKQQEQAVEAVAFPDYSKLKAMNTESVSCKVIKHATSPTLEITGKLGKVTLSPAKGATIQSWRKDGSELVGNEKGGLCADAFWWPSSAISVSAIESAYKLVSQKKSVNGLSLVFERKLTFIDSKSLKGVTLRKGYKFNNNGSFTVTTSIINTTKATIHFSYRRRSISAFMGLNGAKGNATMGNVVFERTFTQKLYRYAAKSDPDLEKSFNMDYVLITKSPSVLFSAPWLKQKVEFIALDKDRLHCFVFWDSGSQKFATFEQIFSKTTLAPGKTWKTTTSWQLTK